MPRYFGEGLKYFQVDVNLYDNDKIDILREQFDDAAVSFWIFLHAEIFNDGYYIDVSERFVTRFCKKIFKKPPELFYQILDLALTIRVFDKTLYTNYKILTSKGIQTRYLFMGKRWERIKLLEEYMLESVNYNDSKLTIYDRNGVHIGYKLKQGELIKGQGEFPKRLHQTKTNSTIATATIPAAGKLIHNHIEANSDLIKDHLTEAHYREPELEKEIEEFFHYNEISNYPRWVLFGHFQTALKNANKLSWFKLQWSAYKVLKKDSKYKFSFENFLGDQSLLFMNGAWNKENWEEALKIELNSKHNQNGHHKSKIVTAPTDYGKP